MDLLSTMGIAAVGGAASKFVEETLDRGGRWIQTFFKDHREVAQQKAIENVKEFLNELAKRVEQLEESKKISQEQINAAQDHPDFSAFLQKALLTAAQTDNKEKHVLLARLVSERLKVEPESIRALSSKMACDLISYITPNQLMILSLAVILYRVRPNIDPSLEAVLELNKTNFQDWLDNWLIEMLKPYQNITFRPIDIEHLESLSCLKVNPFIVRNLNDIFKQENFSYDFEKMKDVNLKTSIKKVWNDGLQKIDLTTVGAIIGVSVSDILSNTTTTFKKGWE